MIRSSWFMVDVPGNVGLPPNICSARARANKHVNPPHLQGLPGRGIIAATEHRQAPALQSSLVQVLSCTPRVAAPSSCTRAQEAEGPARRGRGAKTMRDALVGQDKRRQRCDALCLSVRAGMRFACRACLYRHRLVAHRTMASADARVAGADRDDKRRGVQHEVRMTRAARKARHPRHAPQTWLYAHAAHQAHGHAVYRGRPGQMQCSTQLLLSGPDARAQHISSTHSAMQARGGQDSESGAPGADTCPAHP